MTHHGSAGNGRRSIRFALLALIGAVSLSIAPSASAQDGGVIRTLPPAPMHYGPWVVSSPVDRGWLGIGVQMLDERGRPAAPGVAGAEEVTIIIGDVAEGSPVDSAGIEIGDELVSIDGEPATPESFQELANNLEVGDEVALTILRDEQNRVFTLVAAARPNAITIYRPSVEAMEMQIDSVRNLIFRDMDSLRVVLGEPDGRRALLRIQVDSLRNADSRLRALLQADTVEGRRPFVYRGSPAGDSLPEATLRAFRLRSDSLPDRMRELGVEIRGTFPGVSADGVVAERNGIVSFSPALAGRNMIAGAQMIELNEGLAAYLDVDEGGVFVTEVVEGSPAHDSGLRAGDVIVRMNERPVGSMADIRAELNVSRRTSSATSVDVARKGERFSFSIPE